MSSNTNQDREFCVFCGGKIETQNEKNIAYLREDTALAEQYGETGPAHLDCFQDAVMLLE